MNKKYEKGLMGCKGSISSDSMWVAYVRKSFIKSKFLLRILKLMKKDKNGKFAKHIYSLLQKCALFQIRSLLLENKNDTKIEEYDK